ncbi:NmrA/HSCARG family protein [Streptacidiphilus sp. N1-12]|uniref:NmrA/HSCARG family protein n=2 Tax=Streptacidiphilus alkalitolerans TaxID=3342712 RepID=A0ABV6VKR3_9ACTN
MTQESDLALANLPVAVAGATGEQGGAAARALLRRGRPVRALTRSPGSPAADALRALGADVVCADFDDRATLDAALAGAGTLFAMSTPFGTDLDAEIRQGTALLDAAAAAGVRHIVFTSAANADRATGVPHFDSKHRIERHLAESGVPWTVIGPAVFMDNYTTEWTLQSLRNGVLALPMPADSPLPLIATADIGAFAAFILDHPSEFAGRRIDIAGQLVTPRRIAAAIATASKREITYQEVPLAVIEESSADLASMFRYFQETGLEVDVEALQRSYPQVDWHTIDSWAADQTWDLAPQP